MKAAMNGRADDILALVAEGASIEFKDRPVHSLRFSLSHILGGF